MKQRQHVSAKIKQHWMVDNCPKVRGHKLEDLLQKGRQLLATAPLSTLGCPFSEMRKAARERLVGGNLVRHRLAADSGRERERESREWRECRCPACVQPTLRNHHSPPGLPRRLPATQRVPGALASRGFYIDQSSLVNTISLGKSCQNHQGQKLSLKWSSL